MKKLWKKPPKRPPKKGTLPVMADDAEPSIEVMKEGMAATTAKLEKVYHQIFIMGDLNDRSIYKEKSPGVCRTFRDYAEAFLNGDLIKSEAQGGFNYFDQFSQLPALGFEFNIGTMDFPPTYTLPFLETGPFTGCETLGALTFPQPISDALVTAVMECYFPGKTETECAESTKRPGLADIGYLDHIGWKAYGQATVALVGGKLASPWITISDHMPVVGTYKITSPGLPDDPDVSLEDS